MEERPLLSADSQFYKGINGKRLTQSTFAEGKDVHNGQQNQDMDDMRLDQQLAKDRHCCHQSTVQHTEMKKSEYLSWMQEETLPLFSPKERYWVTHTASGKNVRFAELPEREQRKKKYENMHLMTGMKFTVENKMPLVEPYTGGLDFDVVSYTDRGKHDGAGEAVHFFLYDYEISSVWNKLERVTHSLYKYDYLFAPDFSLFVDDDRYHQLNKQDVYRSRFIAAYWQLCGYQVIPTASWGDVNSFKYCFEGLPENSVIAVCGIGHDQDNAHKTLWRVAVNRLIEMKKPTTLIVYGGKEEEYLQLPVKVKYIPDFINQHLRKL